MNGPLLLDHRLGILMIEDEINMNQPGSSGSMCNGANNMGLEK